MALSDVTMTLRAGEIHCLAGENGSGKSTLIKIMSGVHAPDSGIIHLGDIQVPSLTPREAVQAGVQVIFQDFSLLPNLTVAENIALPTFISRRNRFTSRKEMNEVAEKALGFIGIDLDISKTVIEISIASKQLVAIARAMNQGISLLFMDEATTALTRREINHLFEVVRLLKDQNVATVFVSHKIDEVQEIASTITVLRNGKLAAEGNMADFDRKRIAMAMTGFEISDSKMTSELPTKSSIVLEVENLSSSGVFFDVSFSVKAGEIVGITGLLGSGRSEIAEALFGMLPINNGRIKIDGNVLHRNSPKRALKMGIGYVPADRLTQGLFLTQSISRNIAAASISAYTGKIGFINQAKMKLSVSNWVKNLKIKTKDAQAPVNSLSGGNQQRVVLAKWLSIKPKVFILNGPTVGVDVGSKRDILEIIRDRALEGMAIVIVSDDIPELIQICHRVLIIRDGKLVSEFSGGQLTESNVYGELN